MTTAFGSFGAESNEWARRLCPAGLVPAGGKSGVKVPAASTVRGSASSLLILNTFYTQMIQRYTVKHWASVGSFRRAIAREGVVDGSSTGFMTMGAR